MADVRAGPQLTPYFRDPRVEITIAVTHVDRVAPRHEREILVVRDPWYPFFPARDERRRHRGFDPQVGRVYYLSNTREIHEARLACGLSSHYVNIGCFVDAEIFRPLPSRLEKKYDAVLSARFARLSLRDLAGDHAWRLVRLVRETGHRSGRRAWREAFEEIALPLEKQRELKRHWLACRVPRLALLDPVFASDERIQREKYVRARNCAFVNEKRLEAMEVADIVNQSHASLALSKLEGVCRSSCESLLCGVPVVSTRSRGGRDVWYDDDNSIVVGPNEDDVKDAVAHFRAHPPDPFEIRRRYQERAAIFLKTFRDDVIEPILRRFHVEESAEQVVRTSPFRWWP